MSVVYNGCKKQKRSVLMDIYSIYLDLCRNIKKESPQLTAEQVREKVNFYAKKVLASPADADTIIGFIERYPRRELVKSGKVRPVKRFTPEERAERIKRSDAIRESVIYHAYAETEKIGVIEGYDKDSSLSRTLQRLFRLPTPHTSEDENAQIKKHNVEVIKLFDVNPAHKEKNTKELYAELRKEQPDLTDEQAENILRERRKQIVLDSLKSVQHVTEHIKELTDENLSPEELAKNYFAIEVAVHIATDADDFVKNFSPQFYDLTDEEKDWIFEQNARLSILTDGLQKMRLMANPAYEFIDLDIIHDYDLNVANNMDNVDEYNSEVEEADNNSVEHKNDVENENKEEAEEEPVTYDEYLMESKYDRKALDPEFFDKYMLGHASEDTVSIFFQDAVFAFQNHTVVGIEEDLVAFGFDLKKVMITYENSDDNMTYLFGPKRKDASFYCIESGRTIVAEQDGRMLPLEYKNGHLAVSGNLEDLFTHNREYAYKTLTEELNKLDPWYHRSSKVFKSMRNAFEEAERYGQITKPGNYDKPYLYYRRLLDAANTYLATKPATGGNKWTQRHVKAGRMLKAYAEGRINALKYIERLKVANLAGKTPAEIREITEAEKRVQEKIAFEKARKEDRNARMDNPVKWLADRIENFYDKVKLPENLSVEASDIRTSLKSINATDDKFSAENILATEVYAQTVGFMVLSELVMKEQGILKSDKVGPVAEAVGKMKTEDITKFGRQITISLTGKDMIKGVVVKQNNRGVAFSKSLSGAELENFLNSFDAHDIAEKVSYDIYKGQNITVAGQMAEAQYIDSVKPMRGLEPDKYETALVDFAKKEIVDPINECFVKGEKSTAVNADLAHDILRACVIHSIIQIERSKTGAQKVGNAESMLVDYHEDDIDIKEKIDNSKTFNDMLGKFAGADGSISRERLEKILNDKEPQKVALDVVKVLAAEEQAKNAPANAPQKVEVRKVDAPANAPKAAAPKKAAGKAPQA